MKLSTWSTVIGTTIAAFLVTGCANSSRLADPTSTFAASIPQVQSGAKETTSALIAQDLQLQALIMSKNDTLSEADYQPFVSTDVLVIRMLVLQGLADYSNALKTLAGSGSSSDSQKAADSLTKDLNSVTKDIQTLPDASKPNITGICGALLQIGEQVEAAILAHERDEALKEALKNAQPEVATICDTFAKEMKAPSGVFYSELQHSFREQEATLQDAFSDAKQKWKKDTSATSDPNLTADQKTKLEGDIKIDEKAVVSAAASYASLLQKKEATLGLTNATGIAFERLESVHAALAQEAASSKSPSQSAFDSLKSQLEVISTYTDALKNTTGGK